MIEDYILYQMLLEDRERTFFGHNYHERNCICFILSEEKILYGENYKRFYHTLPEKRTYESIDYDNPVCHSDLGEGIGDEEYIKGNYAYGRLGTNEKHPILAIDAYDRSLDKSLFMLLNHFNIKGDVYVDRAWHIGGSGLANPESALMPIKGIPKYLSQID